MLENRRSTRKKMVLPVKVLIDRDTHLAHTIDITPGGARLGALRQELKVGTTITLQRGAKRGKFCIAWVKQLAPGEVQAGVEALEPNDDFWGVGLSDLAQQNKSDLQTFLMLFSDTSKPRRSSL